MRLLIKHFLTLFLFLLGLSNHVSAHALKQHNIFIFHTHHDRAKITGLPACCDQAKQDGKIFSTGTPTSDFRITTVSENENEDETDSFKKHGELSTHFSAFYNFHLAYTHFYDSVKRCYPLGEYLSYSSLQKHILLRVIRI